MAGQGRAWQGMAWHGMGGWSGIDISGRDEFTTVCRLVSGPAHAAQRGLHCTVENTRMQSLDGDEDGQGIYSSLQSNLSVHFHIHYIHVKENIL